MPGAARLVAEFGGMERMLVRELNKRI